MPCRRKNSSARRVLRSHGGMSKLLPPALQSKPQSSYDGQCYPVEGANGGPNTYPLDSIS